MICRNNFDLKKLDKMFSFGSYGCYFCCQIMKIDLKAPDTLPSANAYQPKHFKIKWGPLMLGSKSQNPIYRILVQPKL